MKKLEKDDLLGYIVLFLVGIFLLGIGIFLFTFLLKFSYLVSFLFAIVMFILSICIGNSLKGICHYTDKIKIRLFDVIYVIILITGAVLIFAMMFKVPWSFLP